jgi:RND superfamily putative drug exporter
MIGVSAFTTVSNSAPLLALMIGLAVGIDYALFILSRHRTQLAQGEEPEESAAMAVGTAGSAVVFAGVTVIIALLGLLVVGIPFLSVMGVGAAFAVLLAIAVATTLLPALLGLAGARLAPRPGSRAHRRATAATDENAQPSMGRRWVRGVMKVPALVTVVVVVLLWVLALPAADLDLNLPDNGSEASDSTQRKAYDLITSGFGPGYNGPLIVAVDITQTTEIMDDLDTIGDELRALDGVAEVTQGIPDETLDTAIIQVVPTSAPADVETKALVHSIRELAPSIEQKLATPIAVTGHTAVAIDISQRLTDALIPFGLIVVGLSIVLLMIVFRSVLVPVKAAAGFLLSVLASFGVVVAVFQWGWLAELLHVENPGPILSFMPIILMAVLFGLAMDYQVFLVSGMREEFVKTGNARTAVEQGFTGGARVVTAAALIMFFVFFAFVPEGAGVIKPIALGLAVGILLDAFVVRMTLVPALMTLFGRAAWWMPGWLHRVLPHADIEGESLRGHRDAVAWASTRQAEAIGASALRVSGVDARLDLSAPRGALVVLSGDATARRMLAATLAGRIEPASGLAHVHGHPLPSDAARVRGLVAVADLGEGGGVSTPLTVAELLGERMRLTGRDSVLFGFQRRARACDQWLRRINAALGTDRVQSGTTLEELTQTERAVVLAALACAERTPVVALDLPDDLAAGEVDRSLPSVLAGLVPSDVTVLLGTAAARDTEVTRPTITIELDDSRKDALL